MQRYDISDNLVHFIKGESFQEAFQTLSSIVAQSKLLGGTGFIRGGYQCVCFSEAPIEALGQILLLPTVHDVKYKPFGVVVSKTWLFERGGRPVIYQGDSEFEVLPESLRWRHVRYEPNGDPPVDFTWEREWRIRTESLEISPDCTQLVFPSIGWFHQMAHGYEEDQQYLAKQYSELTGVPEQTWIEDFPWQGILIKGRGADL